MIRFVRALFLVYFAVAAYGSAQAQTYPLFRPANGILKGQTTTYVTTAAAAVDITATFSGSCSNVTYLRGDGTCATPPGTGGGTVNSVGLTAPSVFSVSGSPVTSAGVLALTFAGGQTQNQVLASPNGTSGAVALRALVAADLPAVPLTTGVTGTLPVANGGTGVATITGPVKGNGTSAMSVAASADITGLWSGTCDNTTFLRGDGACAGAGAVTSVGLTVPSGFSVTGSPVTGAGTLGITGTLNPAAGGTGVATITGPIKGNGTSAFSVAASADIYGLWTGLCSATTYLRGDGQCQTPSGSSVVGANPTATIGLTAVNGASGSFLRADGAPALSQSIVPTWTGVHTFNAAPVIGTSINPDTSGGADLGTSSLRFLNTFASFLCDGACGTSELVGSNSTTARFGNGSAWTAISLPHPVTVAGPIVAGVSGTDGNIVITNASTSAGSELFILNGTATGSHSNTYMDVRRNSSSYAQIRGNGTAMSLNGVWQVNSKPMLTTPSGVGLAVFGTISVIGATCSVVNGSGYTGSCSRGSDGVYSLTLSGGALNNNAVCTASTVPTSTSRTYAQAESSSTATLVQVWADTGVATDSRTNVICISL